MIEPAARSLHEQAEKLGESLRGPITHFASGVERLPAALASFREGADAIGRVGNDLEAIGSASESLSRSSTSLSRIELCWRSGRPPIHGSKKSSGGSTERARRSSRWRARGRLHMSDRAGPRRSSSRTA